MVLRKLDGSRRRLLAQYVTGRKYWMWAIESDLGPGGMLDLIEQYRWSIISPPPGVEWFLSDNPATCIRTFPNGTFTLDAGWGRAGSRLMLPLSPKHLLYCHVGHETSERCFPATPLLARDLRRYLADAAYRSFFCPEIDSELARYRERTVDRECFREERKQWKEFGEGHAKAERWDDPGLEIPT